MSDIMLVITDIKETFIIKLINDIKNHLRSTLRINIIEGSHLTVLNCGVI